MEIDVEKERVSGTCRGAEKPITTTVPASAKEKDGTWKQVDVGCPGILPRPLIT